MVKKMVNSAIEIRKPQIMNTLNLYCNLTTKEKKLLYNRIKTNFPLTLEKHIEMEIKKLITEDYQKKLGE